MKIDTAPWHPEDKAWMAERKKEWAFVQHNLKVLGRPFIDDRNIISTHKKLFFKGFYEPGQYDQGEGGSVFGHKLPLFVMWYHPALTEEICGDVVEQCAETRPLGHALKHSLVALWQFASHKEFKKEYGFLGGKEKIIVPVMLGNRAREIIEAIESSVISMDSLTTNVYNAINSTLRSLNRPYHTGLYMWDYFLTKVDDLDNERKVGLMETAARMVIYFDQDPNTCKDDSDAIELKNKLLKQYESGTFPESLQRMWDKARAEGPRTA
jgi:hypothetical protein